MPFHFYLISNLNLECKDTPSWDNGYGLDCDWYAANEPEYCEDSPHEYNNPDLNCCACGKKGKATI